MVISFFKVSRPASIIALPFIALILWALSIYSPEIPSPESGGPLYRLMHKGLYMLPVVGTLVGLCTLVTGAYLVNRLAIGQEVLNSTTHVTGLCYVSLMSLTPAQTTFHPLMLSCVLVLVILQKLISSYRKETAISDYFDIGFILGLATLIYIPSFVFMPVVWIALILIRPFVWREWVTGLIGFLLSFVLVLSVFYLFDRSDLLQPDIYIPHWMKFPGNLTFGNTEYFTLGTLAVVILLSLSRLYGGVTYSILRARKNLNLLIWSGLFGLASVLFSPVWNASAFSFVAVSGAVFLSNYLLATKSAGWSNFLFYLLSACSIVHHAVHIFSH
ncbi:MAG: hypothetical protein IT233_07945 [Bacteroidia bacterium]|nr:hypothetical protein [Bacteroidia bacterium]